MTVPFPHDPQLPQLQQLLDERGMIRIVDDALHINVIGCKPKYVRYKPYTSCIVQYDLTFICGDAEPVTRDAHIKVYADHRAEAKATGSRAERLTKRLEDIQPDAPKVTFLPELDGALQIYPADLDLRGLARVSHMKGAKRDIKKTLKLDSSPRLAGEPELIRYKPGRKALLRYHPKPRTELPWYGKVFGDISVVDMKANTDALVAAGLSTARVLGINQEHNFIIHETAQGIALNEMRDSEDYLQWIKPLADTLWQLQSIDLPALQDHTLKDEIKALREVQLQLSTLLPHLAQRLARLLHKLETGLSEVDDMLVTSHGDFYDDQAIVGEDGLTLIDLEAMRRSHPLIDAGNMLAHFKSASEQPGDNLRSAHREFTIHTQRHTGENVQTIRVFEAAGLLRLAPGPFRRLEENWQLGVGRLLALAETAIEESQANTVNDSSLPQLNEILDLSEISSPIHQATGQDVQSVDLVRHKPGRRAIMRLQLADSTILYGKTFASSRGPRVFKTTKKITDANAFGPDVLTPEAVAYLPDQKLMLMSEVAGEPIDNQLRAGDLDLVSRIAFALHQFHSSEVELRKWHGLDQELAPLEGRCEDVRQHAPGLAEAADETFQRIQHFDHHNMCWRNRPIHRDFYHDQILFGKENLVVLDLDDAAMSEPAVDVANFATHLLLFGLQETRDSNAYRPMVDAFLRQYSELDPDLDPALVNYLMATTALRLAGIHVSRTNGFEVAHGLITVANNYLELAWNQLSLAS